MGERESSTCMVCMWAKRFLCWNESLQFLGLLPGHLTNTCSSTYASGQVGVYALLLDFRQPFSATFWMRKASTTPSHSSASFALWYTKSGKFRRFLINQISHESFRPSRKKKKENVFVCKWKENVGKFWTIKSEGEIYHWLCSWPKGKITFFVAVGGFISACFCNFDTYVCICNCNSELFYMIRANFIKHLEFYDCSFIFR